MTVSAAVFNVPFEALIDRTSVLVPDVRTFTSNGTWNKPAHALHVSFILVGPGFPGAAASGTTGHAGSGGGCSGGMIEVSFPANLVPAQLSVDVGSNLTPANGAAVQQTAPGASWGLTTAMLTALGTGIIDPTVGTLGSGGLGGYLPDTSQRRRPLIRCAAGGNASGYAGSLQLPGGLAGAGANGGFGGVGYGAGGGGACPAASSGGGGGAGGYGNWNVSAAQGASGVNSGAGGLGAQGVVIITSWCGVNLRA